MLREKRLEEEQDEGQEQAPRGAKQEAHESLATPKHSSTQHPPTPGSLPPCLDTQALLLRYAGACLLFEACYAALFAVGYRARFGGDVEGKVLAFEKMSSPGAQKAMVAFAACAVLTAYNGLVPAFSGTFGIH